MPKLRTVSFVGSDYSDAPWLVLSAVMSTPQIRNVQFRYQVAPEKDLGYEGPPGLLTRVAPLSTLVCTPQNYPDKDRATAEELAIMDFMTEHAHESLEVVVLPSDVAPYDAFRRNEWPRLRELTLRGPRHSATTGGAESESVMMDALARMPKLRVLKLELSQPRGVSRQRIWPAGLGVEDAGFPWPDLETLLVSYPHPEDQVYAHLPRTLRRLALRCWPRHYTHLGPTDRQGMDKRGWCSPILTATEMLSVVRRCGTNGPLREVEHLDLEFEDDERCGELFRHILEVFPNVVVLTIHRYRGNGWQDSDMTVVSRSCHRCKLSRKLITRGLAGDSC